MAPVTSLSLAYDDPDFILAYIDDSGIHEAVLKLSDVALEVVASRLIVPAMFGVTLFGIAYAPGPVRGGGRYVWRATNTSSGIDSIFTALRDSTRP